MFIALKIRNNKNHLSDEINYITSGIFNRKYFGSHADYGSTKELFLDEWY